MNQSRTVSDSIAAARLVPVVVLDDASDGRPLAEALLGGGLPIAEVTFRTAAAERAVAAMAGVQDLLVGAGTVLTVDTVKRAVDAGSKFIVSPGFSPVVVGYCVENGIPVFPGAVTPTEIMAAMEFGLDVVKFFPAESFGGLKTIKALAGPFPGVKFIPTGGITESTLAEYLSFPAVLAVGGSWFVDRKLIAAKRFDEIARLTGAAVEIVRQSSRREAASGKAMG